MEARMRPQQQTLWDWADQSEISSVQHHNAARALLAQRLQARLSHPLDLHVHNNRKRMMTVRFTEGQWRIRVHHMFLGCEDAVLDALARFTRGDATAREVLTRYIEAHRDAIDHSLREQLHSKGRYHDLNGMLERARALIAQFGHDVPDKVVIGWGRRGNGRRSIRLGSFDPSQDVIRIHPALDQAWVPSYFVEYIVYHEALHSVIEPIYDRHRRLIHTADFLRLERQFPRYTEALDWEKANLRRLLQGS